MILKTTNTIEGYFLNVPCLLEESQNVIWLLL
ncbi:Uncharacterised protein [Mycobacteroides abscessus subsp. abscessus]|nr:Uncharacterised protein [Mycobacteroides abscessus subsp. abscessus]